MRVSFGDCVLDTGARTLLRSGAEVVLPPKAFQLLVTLVERRPEAVAQTELRDLIWPDSHVGHTSLARLVSHVREAIGDDSAEPRHLRTVRGFGYAFGHSPVDSEGETPADGVTHRLFWSGRSATLEPGENVVGRGRGATVWIEAASVSRRHAIIRVEGTRAFLTDLGSKNGTKVCGQEGVQGFALRDGDEIELGQQRVVYRSVSTTESTETSSRRR